jgi:hypothetical protein
MPTAAHARQLTLEPPRPTVRSRDELELGCIVCFGPVGRTEKVAYWPPTKDRPGVIGHIRCLSKREGSL